MIKNPKALMTLVRNKLNVDQPLEERMKWFHEKGITVIEKDGRYYLKADPRGHHSELSDVCNNVIFHNQYLCAFPGWIEQETSWTDLKKNEKFVLDDNTIFTKPLDEGHTIYMYWDEVDIEWKFSSTKKLESPYAVIVKNMVKNIMAGEYCYTYNLRLIESGDNKGLYLESLFNHKTFKEESLQRLVQFATRFEIKHTDLFVIKNNLEKEDLPLIVRDVSGNKYKITSL